MRSQHFARNAINRLCLLIATGFLCAAPALAQTQPNSEQNAHPAYVGSSECRECHQSEAQEWDQSHHARAWLEADETSVVADFNNTTFTHQGVTTTFTIENGTYMIDTQGPDGVQRKYPVAGVAGFTPLQQFLIETEPGRLQSFDVTWDDEKKRWYHLYPDQDLPYDNGLHWTGPYKNWNARCAECHATGFEKNYDARSRTYASTQSEIGVGCEACHGPGEAHLDWAKNGEDSDLSRWVSLSNTGFSMDFNQGAEAQIQQCAGCHARREPYEDGNPMPGTAFHDAYRLSTLRPGLYHPDGQILDEVYVYGSFLQSKMYDKGVTCTNCHNAHTGENLAEGNVLCAQCHSETGNADFPTLQLKDYDTAAHHFHPEDSEGAQCVSCHMIERDYMGIDGRRDHSFRIPRPDLSLETGAPNACTDCHTDQSSKWAAEQIASRFPDSDHRGTHYGSVLAKARTSPNAQTDNLIDIAMHDALPGIVRASALDILAQISNPDIASRTQDALQDPDPTVRVAAIGAQRGASAFDVTNRVTEMLGDPTKAVRIAAARAYLALPIARLPERIAADRRRAMGEWQGAMQAKADFPESQMVIAGIALTTRRIEAALAAFSEAVELDPQLEQAWIMIIRIHGALEDYDAALKAAEAATEAVPGSIELSLMKSELLR